MANNLVFRNTDAENEIWPLAATTGPGKPVISISDQPGVTLTGTGDYVTSFAQGPYTISGIKSGGVSLEGKECSIATNGTFDFLVVGGLTTTPQNTLVYLVVADNTLTLTASTNKKYGKVNLPKGYLRVAGTLPVKIGVFA